MEGPVRRVRLRKAGSEHLRERFARELNPAQLAAATADGGSHLILAGPGSGKTRVITYRVAYLLAKGVPAENILLVTFTRRAARELIARLETLSGPDATRIWAGTFHHVGNRILRQVGEKVGLKPGFTILDGEDQQSLVKMAMGEAGLLGTGRYAPTPKVIIGLFSMAFNLGLDLRQYLDAQRPDLQHWAEQLLALERGYTERKRMLGCVDYDDLLGLWVQLLREHPEELERQARQFQQILVDEVQDTNRIQIELVESIAHAGPGNLTVVGDDAQSIYKFRGAHYQNILKFAERNPGTTIHRLETNYRSTPEIVAFTNASIAQNVQRLDKTLQSARGPGLKPVLFAAADPRQEAELVCQLVLDGHEQGIPLGKMAVLYRNHHDSLVLQDELVARRIPYDVRSGMRFFEQAHIKDVLAHLRLFVNPRDEVAWRRLLELLPGVGPATSGQVYQVITAADDPLSALAQPRTIRVVPEKSRGFFGAFVADLRKIAASQPMKDPSAAITAILQTGYPDIVRTHYSNPENRLADIEQMAIVASRYDNLQDLVSQMVLAGEVYAVDTVESSNEPGERLVLSSIHQSKGLEWLRVFVIRLVEDSFPSVRARDDLDGLEEERRVFYVAVTRAMDELILTYPQMIQRGRGPLVLAQPSRFVTEIPGALLDQGVVESDVDLAFSSGPAGRGSELEPGLGPAFASDPDEPAESRQARRESPPPKSRSRRSRSGGGKQSPKW
jgi:DNA helicase-2/ATP-dependent DNA helicase PcrA